MTLDPLELARRVVDVMVEKQAEDILLLDLREVSILADYFVIGTATSERQAQAIIEGIRVATKDGLDVRPIHVEGESSSGWVLLDYGSVVAHVFAPDARKYYDLEGFWRSGRVVVRLM